MVNDAFRDPNRTSTIWVEVMPQAWATDGGIPLMIAYIGAACAVMYDSLRIALTTRDRELGFWAAVIVAQNLASMVLCSSYPTFLRAGRYAVLDARLDAPRCSRAGRRRRARREAASSSRRLRARTNVTIVDVDYLNDPRSRPGPT